MSNMIGIKEGSFEWALMHLKNGSKVRRKGWNGKTQYLEIAITISYVNSNGEVIEHSHSTMGNKAIAFVGTTGTQIGWLASQADMLSEDWMLVS